MPVAVITGARQTGKSTLVRTSPAAGQRTYLSLDDLGVRDRARSDPDTLLRSASPITIDEVQREPDLLLAIKRAVDENRERGRFLLTGSANLLLLQSVTESLAGRAAYMTLWPLTRREQLGLGSAGIWSELLETEPAAWLDLIGAQVAPRESWIDLALRGGYPPAAVELTDTNDRRIWLEGYATTYLERDVRSLSAVDRLTDFRRVMAASCLRLGGLQNQAGLARDVNLPPTTVQRYLDLLEVTFQLVRVPAYSVNRTKRLIKAPKLYWSDTALALQLAGEIEPRGPHLENLILCDLLAWSGARLERTAILHWRTAKGAEVDFVIETARHVLPIEVKASAAVRSADIRHLETFLDEYSDVARTGVLLYDGDDAFWLSRRVLAAPWWMIV
jgi:predicted AAA+ superfamily ATPase